MRESLRQRSTVLIVYLYSAPMTADNPASHQKRLRQMPCSNIELRLTQDMTHRLDSSRFLLVANGEILHEYNCVISGIVSALLRRTVVGTIGFGINILTVAVR
jgi:hypothetical protein